MLTLLLFAAACLVGSFFAWATIHEVSHLWAAKKLVGVSKYKIKPYPHIHPTAGFRWAGVEYWPERKIEPTESALISLAPRLPDMLAAAMCPLALLVGSLLGLFPAVAWFLFWGSGVVDLLQGSMGYSEYSDLRKAAAALNISPWILRSFAIISLPSLFLVFDIILAAMHAL